MKDRVQYGLTAINHFIDKTITFDSGYSIYIRRILQLLSLLAAVGVTALLLFKILHFDGWQAKKETIIYSLPLVFLLFVWIAVKIGERATFDSQIFLVDSLVVLLAASRLFALFFHSGHVLFLMYTYATTRHKWYRLLCLPMIGVTAYFKIVYWGDWLTSLIGGIMAAAFILWRNVLLEKFEQLNAAILDAY